MSDDDRISYLAGEEPADLSPAERAEIDRLRGLLADPAVWAEPSLDLQEQVVAAVAEASGGRRRRWIRYAVPSAAAAAVLAVALTVSLQSNQALQYAAPMAGTELAPKATGDVTLTKTESGWKVHLHATGLPRRADGEFYEAWLKDDAGTLVPIGTFNDGNDVTLWAGVSPSSFPTLTVTREVADGNQASSGQVVLVGASHRS